LLQCLALILFLAIGSVAVSGGLAFDRFAVQNNDYTAKGPRSLVNALDRAGVLGIVKNLVPEVGNLIVQMENLFHALDRDRHRHISDLNRVLGHLKDTWSLAIDEMMSQKGSQVVDVNAFHSFLEVYKVLLDRAIREDSLEGSDVVQFMGQLDHLFRVLESAYAAVYLGLKDILRETGLKDILMGMGIPSEITWSLFSSTKNIVNRIPNNSFDPELLGDLMRTPKEMMNQFTVAFEELFEKLMISPFGQWVPIVTGMINAATMNAARQRFNEKAEL